MSWETNVVVRWPLLFLLAPPLFTVTLVGFTVADFHLNVSNDSLQVFLPDQMQSLTDLKELIRLFPPEDPQRDSYSIFGSRFAYTVVEDLQGNAFSNATVQEMARLHKAVARIRSPSGKNYSQLCLKFAFDGGCQIHPLAFALEDEDPLLTVQFLLHYPLLKFGEMVIDNAVAFGGVTLETKSVDEDGNGPVSQVRAVRIIYALEHSDEADSWIQEFLKLMETYRANGTKLYRSSSKSLANEMERNGNLLIPMMPWTALFLVSFCMTACLSFDAVRCQPFIGVCAMLNATMATVTATAFLILVRYPFLPLVFIMPFLIVAIGTDNMFIMLKSWRMSHDGTLEQKFIGALTETAASLFITSLTDGLSFSIGSVSDFYAVRVFCTYCAMAMLFMFFYQITFFTAAMLLCCRREHSNRHWLLCYRMPIEKSLRNITIRPLPSTPSPTLGQILSNILHWWPAKILVLILYVAYLVIGVFYVLTNLPKSIFQTIDQKITIDLLKALFSEMPLGLDLKLLPPDDSYVAAELDMQERLFSDFGSNCFAVVRLRNQTIIEPRVRERLLDLYDSLSGTMYASKGEFFLTDFMKTTVGLRPYPKAEFMSLLHTFLAQPQYRKYSADIRFTMSGDIEAIKMLMRVRKLGKQNDPMRAELLRGAMVTSGFDGFVYDTSFLLVDQQLTTVKNVISDVLTAIVTMLVICTLMVPKPVSASCIAVAIVSINIGVIGTLSALNTRLDIISMITIVMSVGFSVDYVTHTTFHYVIQEEHRLERCLLVMTDPILQSALSTLAGVALLSLVHSYIVRTFVISVVAVVLIGVLHGLIFLPVLLDFVVPRTEFLAPYHRA